MYIFKSCPKCRGDLAVEQDEYSRAILTRDTDFSCLQCGYRLGRIERKALIARILQQRAARSLANTLGGNKNTPQPAM